MPTSINPSITDEKLKCICSVVKLKLFVVVTDPSGLVYGHINKMSISFESKKILEVKP